MKYKNIVEGNLIRRVNRFIAEVTINDEVVEVHVKNTGRLKELLLPGAKVILEESNNPNRKTRYSLISVYKDDRIVNIDSQMPNLVAYNALVDGKIEELGELHFVKREVTYGASRFDLYFESEKEKGFIEVKGVTLEKNGVAMFPDAPTTRGTKHVLELAKASQEGFSCAILFIIQMKGCHTFRPNVDMDPDFSEALKIASKQGVQLLAYDTIVTEDDLILDQPIDVRL